MTHDPPLTYKSLRQRFAGSLGFELAGVLEGPEPAHAILAAAVFAHPFTSSKDLKSIVRISRSLAKRGIAVLRFDFTGLGTSRGNFSETTLTNNAGDCRQAAIFLSGQVVAPLFFIGLSLGGNAVLLAAKKSKQINGVITINTPSDAKHVLRHFPDQINQLNSADEIRLTVAGRPIRIKKKFVEDLNGHDTLAAVGALAVPLLVIQAAQDGTVSGAQATQLSQQAKNGELALLKRGDHLLTDREVCNSVSEQIFSFIKKTIG